MKFNLIKIGQQFEYQGKTYVKTTPVVASNLETGEQKLIPRSATLKLKDEVAPIAQSNESSAQQVLEVDKVTSAVQHYHAQIREILGLTEDKLDAGLYTELQQRVTRANATLLDALEINRQD